MDKINAIVDEEIKLNSQVNALKIEAKELNEKLLNLKWKIKRADFLAFYEAKEREEHIKNIQNINIMVDSYEEKSTGVDIQYEQQKTMLRTLQASHHETIGELQGLRLLSQKNESTITELNRSINVLKNRNAAMMTKLKKQKGNFDEQIQKFSEQMEQ